MSTTQPPPAAGADAASLLAKAEAAGQAGQFEAARDAYASALQAMAASDPPALRVRTLGGMGWTMRRRGDPAAALQWFEQAFATQRRTDPGTPAGMATLHTVMAEALMALGRFNEALAEHEAVLALGGVDGRSVRRLPRWCDGAGAIGALLPDAEIGPAPRPADV